MKVTRLPRVEPRRRSPYRNKVHEAVCNIKRDNPRACVDVVDVMNRHISFINPRGLHVRSITRTNDYYVIVAE